MKKLLQGNLSAIARELPFAVRNNEELNNLSFCVTIAQGGMLSNIH